MRLTYPALITLALAAILIPLASAQDGVQSNVPGAGFATPTPSTPTIHVYSRETIVDVTVTDAKGNPVHGLTQSDFTITQDGKPQSIHSFKDFGNQTPTPQMSPKLPPGTYTNDGAVPTVGPVNIILLDVMHTPSDSMEIAKRQVVDFLKTMPPGTEVAVFILSKSPLDHAMCAGHLLQGFTSDASVAAATVAAYADLRVDPTFIPSFLCPMTLGVLKQITAYVSGIKGRKNLMWFAPSVPAILMPDGGYAEAASPLDPATVARNRSMYDIFVAEQIAVYPILTDGVANGTPSLSEDPTIQHPSLNQAMAAYSLGHAKNIVLAEAVAKGTGGEAIYNTNDFKAAVAKVVRDGSNFYTISYVPPPFPIDTRYHLIDVKVNRPNLTLGYRKGFNAEDDAQPPATKAPNQMQAAMTGDAPSASQILFDVHVQPSTQPAKPTDPPVMGTLNPKLKKSPLTRYGLLYSLPTSQVTFADGPDGTHNGALEFDVAAFDTEGIMVTALSQSIKMPLTADEYKDFIKMPFQFFQQIDLPAGNLTLRAGVLDSVGNKVGTLEIPLTVPNK